MLLCMIANLHATRRCSVLPALLIKPIIRLYDNFVTRERRRGSAEAGGASGEAPHAVYTRVYSRKQCVHFSITHTVPGYFSSYRLLRTSLIQHQQST